MTTGAPYYPKAAGDIVIIGTNTNNIYPDINGTSFIIGSITFSGNGNLTMSGTNPKLNVNGDFTNNSATQDVVGTLGTIEMKGNTNTSINGSNSTNFNILKIAKLNSTYSVTISTTAYIRVSLNPSVGVLASSSADIILVSDISSGSTAYVVPLGASASVTSQITLQQADALGSTCFHYLSSPVGDASSNGTYSIDAQFSDNISSSYRHYNNYNYAYNAGTNTDWYLYNESACSGMSIAAMIANWYAATSVTLTNDQSDWFRSSYGWTCNSSLGSQGLPASTGIIGRYDLDLTSQLDWKGYLNDGDIVSPNLTLNTCDTWDGVNLIGNPYPSPLDWDLFYGDNSTYISPFANIWQPDFSISPFPGVATANKGYMVLYDASYTSLPLPSYFSEVTSPYYNVNTTQFGNNLIAIGQGFGVTVNTSNITLDFHNSQRISDETVLFRREQVIKDALQLVVKGNEGNDYTQIYVGDNFIDDFDFREDAPKQKNQRCNLFTSNNNGDIAINRLKTKETSFSVPLNFSTSEQEIYTFQLSQVPFVSDKYTLWFEDKTTKQMIAIDEGFNYSFNARVGETRERFVIHFTTGISNLTSNTFVNSYYVNGQLNLTVNEIENENCDVTITDLGGRIIHRSIINFTNGKGVIPFEKEQGIYIVSVNSFGNNYNQKLSIIK